MLQNKLLFLAFAVVISLLRRIAKLLPCDYGIGKNRWFGSAQINKLNCENNDVMKPNNHAK